MSKVYGSFAFISAHRMDRFDTRAQRARDTMHHELFVHCSRLIFIPHHDEHKTDRNIVIFTLYRNLSTYIYSYISLSDIRKTNSNFLNISDMTDSQSPAAKSSHEYGYASVSSKFPPQWEEDNEQDDDGLSKYIVSKRISGRFSPAAPSSQHNKAKIQTPVMRKGDMTPGVSSESKWKPVDTPAKSPFVSQTQNRDAQAMDHDMMSHESAKATWNNQSSNPNKNASSNPTIPKFTSRPSLNSDYRLYHDALLTLLNNQDDKRRIRGHHHDPYMQYVHTIMRSVYAQATTLKRQTMSNKTAAVDRLEFEGHLWSLIGTLLHESQIADEDFLLFVSHPSIEKMQRDIEAYVQNVVQRNAALDPAALTSLVHDSFHVANEGVMDVAMSSPPSISKRRQCILEWLQSCHGQGVDISSSEHTCKVMWKDSIQNIVKTPPSSLTNKKIDSIHPDAPFFVNDISPLFGNDNKDEVELLTKCLVFLQSGRFGQALDLCVESGQPWRAAVWDGNLPHGYAFIDNDEDDMKDDDVKFKVLVGNPQRALWKRTIWRASEAMHLKLRKEGYGSLQVSSGALAIEAAICAILADDFKTASSNPILSTNWMNKLWLFYHCLQARLMELIYHSHNNHRRSVAYGEQFPFEGTLFLTEEKEQLLCTADMSRIDEESFLHGLQRSVEGNKFWFNAISAFLIGIDEVKRFLYNMGSQLVRFDDTFTEEYESQLRFMVHLILFLESFCNIEFQEYSTFVSRAIAPHRNELIIVYLRRLSSEKPLWEFFALYASILPNNLLVDACAKFWCNMIFNEKDRRMVIKQARNYFDEGVDLDILRQVVRTTLNTNDDDESVNDFVPSWRAMLPSGNDGLDNESLEKNVSSVDIFKLHSMYWLTFHDDHYLEALTCGNMLLRELLLSVPTELSANVDQLDAESIADWSASSKLYAAKLLQSRILTSSIADKVESAALHSDDVYASSCVLEYHALSKFLHAHSAYEAWMRYISTTSSSVQWNFYDTFIESSIESEVAIQTEILKYAKCKREIAIGMFKAAETARGALVSVLEFEDVGWLKIPHNNGSEEDTTRSFQVEQLRNICLPFTLSLAYIVLNKTARWMTEFHHEIFETFGAQRGKEVYSRIEYDGGISFLESPFDPTTWYKCILRLANTVAATEFDISSCLTVDELNAFMQSMSDASLSIIMLKEN